MPINGLEPCDGTEITIEGAAPYAKPDGGLFPVVGDDYAYAPATYTICLSDATVAKLFPAQVAPAPSSDSGLMILVVAALIAQLVINVITIRKPPRSRS